MVQLKLVLPNGCEMTGRPPRVHPIPEVAHVMNDIPTLHLRKKPIVWTDDDGILLLCKVKDPFGEPSRKQTRASDLIKKVSAMFIPKMRPAYQKAAVDPDYYWRVLTFEAARDQNIDTDLNSCRLVVCSSNGEGIENVAFDTVQDIIEGVELSVTLLGLRCHVVTASGYDMTSRFTDCSSVLAM